MAKKFTFIMFVLLIVSACVFVSCKNEVDNTGDKETWSATITESYKDDDDVLYTATSTMMLMFDGKGNIKVIVNIDTLLADGVDVTEDMPEDSLTTTMTGTYNAISETQGTITYTKGDETITANYAIQGKKLLLSADGKSQMFTKK